MPKVAMQGFPANEVRLGDKTDGAAVPTVMVATIEPQTHLCLPFLLCHSCHADSNSS